MAKKKEIKKDDNLEVVSEAEMKEVQKEINEELLKEKKEKEKAKKNNSTYMFFKFFFKRLKEDKLYLFSFIITIIFLGFFSINKLKQTEGYYDKKNDSNVVENNVTPTVNTDLNKKDNNVTVELDISDYVGIYSREITMTEPLKISDSCTIDSYKYVYQIKKDKSITKYLVNNCLGTIKIWNDNLDYVTNNGARYISANGINFLFSNSSMKEVDGETYKIDDEITSLKVNQKNKNIETYIFDSNFVLLTDSDLVLVKGNNVAYQLSKSFISKGGDINKRVYKSAAKNQFNFIVFYNTDNKNCYLDEEIAGEDFKDGELYKIYSVKYDTESGTFGTEKEIISRNKSDGCSNYEEDIEALNE